jgi:hypothetical protein
MPRTPPAFRTSRAAASARSDADPPSRRIGICPAARKNQAVFHESKYSALATKVTLRRITNGKKNESQKEVWFGARMTGPRLGTLLRPVTRTRQPI